MLKKLTSLTILLSLLLFSCAWHNAGHELITNTAGKIGKNILPAFFTDNIGQAIHCSVDPDIFKEKLPDSSLKTAEYSEHFFDLEFFTDNELPSDRYAFALWCFKHDLQPGKVGTLPWALTEYTQKLTIAFAEYRKWPNNKFIQNKCLVYAGVLAHYAGDAGMPLHATKHYDGIIQEKSSSKKMKGIHLKLDALIEKIPAHNLQATDKIQPITITSPILPNTFRFIKETNSLVQQSYDLYDKIPELRNKNIEDNEVLNFAIKLHQRSSAFLAGLYIHAWNSSEHVSIPQWHTHSR